MPRIPGASGLKDLLPAERANRLLFIVLVTSIVMSIGTLLLFERVDAFRAVGGELLSNPDFDQGMAGWEGINIGEVRAGAVVLASTGGDESHILRQVVRTPPGGLIRVTADARLVAVIQGPLDWHNARVGVLGLDTGGQVFWDFSGNLFAKVGTHRLEGISRVIKVPSRYRSIRIEAELTGGSGALVLERLSLAEVEPRPLVEMLRSCVLAVWFALLPLSVVVMWRFLGGYEAVLLATGAGLLLFLPTPLRQGLQEAISPEHWPVSVDHLLLFVVLGMVILRRSGANLRASTFYRILALLVMAVSLEVVQYYAPGRTPDLRDLWSNLAGIGFSVIFWQVWWSRKRSL